MSGIAVVDASALAALVFFEPNASVARDRLANRQLVAPRLLAYELMNAALKKLRKHPDQSALIRSGVSKALSDDFTIFWSDVEPDEVLELATQSRLTAYDAAYLWLARHLDAELVTFDTALEAAARNLELRTENSKGRRLQLKLETEKPKPKGRPGVRSPF